MKRSAMNIRSAACQHALFTANSLTSQSSESAGGISPPTSTRAAFYLGEPLPELPTWFTGTLNGTEPSLKLFVTPVLALL